MQKGNIGVTTENIFPIIKKFLYSDHEIFLRELVSNAVDATQKLNTLASISEFKGELGDLTVHVSLGKDTREPNESPAQHPQGVRRIVRRQSRRRRYSGSRWERRSKEAE